MLRTYRKCDPTIGFSKYEFNNKLMVGVTFFRITYTFFRIKHPIGMKIDIHVKNM